MESKSTTSLVGQVLKDYRKAHKLTQEQLAYDLGIEPRKLRVWENENPPKNIHELRRIADLLGIEPERIGVAASIYIPKTPEQIEEVINHVWSLIDESRIQEAQTIIERLIHNVQAQITIEDPALLRGLAHAHHAAGYVASVSSRSYESHKALPHYHEVESIARIIHDHTLINIGLTYQGDMNQRMGDAAKAIAYLEAARDTTPHADRAALGNGIQLLGRAYLRVGNVKGFEQAMAESEELTYTFDPATSSIHGHYSLGTIYEEYGRSYANLGQMEKALEYLNRAQATLPQNKFWELCIRTAQAIALVKGGELEKGGQLAAEAAEECRATGNIRFLDRIHIIDRYLESLAQRAGKVRGSIHEALYGGQQIEI